MLDITRIQALEQRPPARNTRLTDFVSNAKGAAAYSAAPRGTFRGTGTAGDAVFTIIVDTDNKVLVSCTYSGKTTDNFITVKKNLFARYPLLKTLNMFVSFCAACWS